MESDQERAALVDAVIAEELDMFLDVQNRGGTSFCQEHPQTFRTMRRTSHSVQSDAFLQSYLEDLRQAKAAGRNLMVEKYALMENLIPELSEDARIGMIVQAEGQWRDTLALLYPDIFRPDAGAHFRVYLSCELQTLSAKTLALYYDTVAQAQREGRNLVRERYEDLMRRLGFGSLAERQAALRG